MQMQCSDQRKRKKKIKQCLRGKNTLTPRKGVQVYATKLREAFFELKYCQ